MNTQSEKHKNDAVNDERENEKLNRIFFIWSVKSRPAFFVCMSNKQANHLYSDINIFCRTMSETEKNIIELRMDQMEAKMLKHNAVCVWTLAYVYFVNKKNSRQWKKKQEKIMDDINFVWNSIEMKEQLCR